MHKLEESGYAEKITSEETSSSAESWCILHHTVHHDGKATVVFNCAFRHQQTALNDNLLPGPSLGPSLLGVLHRFREHVVVISGDILYVVCFTKLDPEDRSLLLFIWRDMESNRPPDVYEWHVLSFGTACSPCCAIHAVQRHVRDHQSSHKDLLETVLTSFYVDNCLKSLHLPLPQPNESAPSEGQI